MTKVYFISHNKSWGSSKLRGLQVAKKLKTLGYKSEFILVSELDFSIQDSICIWIKFPNIEVINKLPKNKHILDVVDAFDYCKQFLDHKSIHGFIVNNNYMKNYCEQHFLRKKNIFTIPHQWDPDLKYITLSNQSKLNFGYLGSISSLRRDQNFLHYKFLSKQFKIKFLDCEFCQDLTSIIQSGNDVRDPFDYERKNIKNLNLNFNCHISIRDPKSNLFKHKTSAKIATAAFFNHNIITTAEESVVDILPQDYPFLLKDAELDSIISMIKKIQLDFSTGKDLWRKGLQIIKKVKTDLSLDNICADYINIFSQIRE